MILSYQFKRLKGENWYLEKAIEYSIFLLLKCVVEYVCQQKKNENISTQRLNICKLKAIEKLDSGLFEETF